MGLVIDGHDVKGLALGGNSFYSLQKNDDGSITVDGQKYSVGSATPNFFKVETKKLVPNGNSKMLTATIDDNYKNILVTKKIQIVFELGDNSASHILHTDWFNVPINNSKDIVLYVDVMDGALTDASITYNNNGEMLIYQYGIGNFLYCSYLIINYV